MKKIFLAAVLFIPLLATLKAQQVNNELKDLIEKSFTYFPKLQEAGQSIVISEERVDLAKTGYVPGLNASFTYNYISPVGTATFPTGPSTTQTIQFQPNHNINGNIALNYVVYDFGRLQSTIQKSKQDLQLSKDNVEYQKVQLAAQVAQFYYGMIYLKKSIAIEDSLLNVLTENKRMVQARLNGGDALQLDMLNIESVISQENIRKTDLETQYQKQVIFLKYLTGVDGVSVTNLLFDYALEVKSSSQYLDNSVSFNYEFNMLNDRLNMFKSDLKNIRSQFLPYFSVNASAGVRNGYQPDINEMRFNYVLGAGINIPILDAVKNKQQIRITKAVIQQQELGKLSLENNYRKDIELVMADIESGKKKLTEMQDQLSAAQEAVRITNVKYTNGTSTYLELINAAYTLQKIMLQQVQIEYSLCLSNIELARLSGVKFY
jgi:outer membrane protein